MTVNGSAKVLQVRGVLQAVVTVTDDLGRLDVRDDIFAAAVGVGDTLGLLKVGGNITEESTVQARVIRRQAIGGQVFGQVIVTG